MVFVENGDKQKYIQYIGCNFEFSSTLVRCCRYLFLQRKIFDFVMQIYCKILEFLNARREFKKKNCLVL